MKFHNPTAECFMPDAAPVMDALARTTHLAIGAHQDDIELMAVHGILACIGKTAECFGGVVCTNGAGSARVGPYADVTNEQMVSLRHAEQRAAAMIGRYSFVAQLDYASADVKKPGRPELTADLLALLQACKPKTLYTHNPADKHDTHIGVLLAVIAACRALPRAERPSTVYGCEIWRGLDWMCDNEKLVLDVSEHQNLQAALFGVYDSQIAGGKRYDLAILGRHRTNATMFESHAADKTEMAAFAMDLTPLVMDETLDPVAHVTAIIRRFETEVQKRLRKLLG